MSYTLRERKVCANKSLTPRSGRQVHAVLCVLVSKLGGLVPAEI